MIRAVLCFLNTETSALFSICYLMYYILSSAMGLCERKQYQSQITKLVQIQITQSTFYIF